VRSVGTAGFALELASLIDEALPFGLGLLEELLFLFDQILQARLIL